jgi:hypothetical protein
MPTSSSHRSLSHHSFRSHRARPSIQLQGERNLRAAAATVAGSRLNEISAARVVGVLGLDDRAAFEDLIARLVDEYGVEASVRVGNGTFTVRFSHPARGS